MCVVSERCRGNDGEVGIRWDVLIWGRVGLVGGAVRRYSGGGV